MLIVFDHFSVTAVVRFRVSLFFGLFGGCHDLTGFLMEVVDNFIQPFRVIHTTGRAFCDFWVTVRTTYWTLHFKTPMVG